MKKILALLLLAGFSTSCFGVVITDNSTISTGSNPKYCGIRNRSVADCKAWKVRLKSENRWITSWQEIKGSITISTTRTGEALPSSFTIQLQSIGKYPATAGATRYMTIRKDGATPSGTYTISGSGTQQAGYAIN